MHATVEAGGMVTLEGTATPGATVKTYDGDKLLGEATVGADGKWTMTMPMLAAGSTGSWPSCSEQTARSRVPLRSSALVFLRLLVRS